ncbi:glycosyltransferase family 2 protein [Clostridium sp. DMHC 10]|uniref:glycosyltransferase family 2 protein n=1 Tax=Clostridium sp. DMHC 10 TaxID=747377 RepID=UPI00069E4947|nr:glycosyltransferase family 2 protein [Clostridium sp. DMHC 10]
MEKISVIVPVYNSEKYLRRCVDSILSQTNQNLELILVDDGSTDMSPEICDSYSSIDNRITVKHIKNAGVSNARNIGIDIAKFEYISFVDSDDWIEPNLLEILLKYAQKSDLVIAGFEIIYPSFKRNCIPTKKSYIRMDDFLQDFSFYYKGTVINSPCAKIYKKSILSGLHFDSTVRLGEDFDFNLKYFDKCRVVSLTDEAKYIYDCNNDSSATKKYHKGDLEQLLQVNKKGNDFCMKYNIENQASCLDEYLCYNGIHMLDVIANSDMVYEEKLIESKKLLNNHQFVEVCHSEYSGLPLKIIIAKKLCLLKNYFPLYVFFTVKRFVKNNFKMNRTRKSK